MAFDLKKEEDVKEYLHNLGIEYKFGCYSEKKSEVCHLLGDFLETIKKDFSGAGKVYKMNCDEFQYARSCKRYGGYALIGKGDEKPNPAVAFEYLKKGCELGSGTSCTHAGILAAAPPQESENGVKQDVPLGISMLTKACNEHSDEMACFYLSGVYLKGIEGHLEKNMQEAYKLSLKACEFGNPYACANVSQMHKRGDGVKKDDNLADIFKQRAMQLQDEVKQARPQLQFQQGVK